MIHLKFGYCWQVFLVNYTLHLQIAIAIYIIKTKKNSNKESKLILNVIIRKDGKWTLRLLFKYSYSFSKKKTFVKNSS